MQRDRQAEARCLGESNAAWHDRVEDRGSEMTADLGGDIGREVRPAVEHRQDDALDLEIRVEVVANEIHGGNQLGKSFKGVVLALDRDQHGVGGGKRIDGEETDRRRAIEKQVVVIRGDLREQSCETPFTLICRRELHLGAGEANGGGNDE